MFTPAVHLCMFVCLSSTEFNESTVGEELEDYWQRNCTDSTFLRSSHIYKHPVTHLITLSQHTICLIPYSSARFCLASPTLFHISLLPSLLFHCLCHCLSLFFSSRIRQAKVQILPERILPDPLSAVQLTPLSRLHMHPSSKPPTQSCKQAQCWWNNYQQVRHTNTYTQHKHAFFFFFCFWILQY